MKAPINHNKFKVGDMVTPVDNFLDEQLGEYAFMGPHKVIAIKKVTEYGTSGQWIKTDKQPTDWIDSAWFTLYANN